MASDADLTVLPAPDAVLTLPDGRIVRPDGSVVNPKTTMVQEMMNAKGAVALVEKMQRNLGDLPDVPKNMNPIACVLTYSAIGLGDADIALALSTTVENITRLKDSDIYQQLFKMFDERVFEDERRNSQHIISKHLSAAANKMVSLIHADSADLALAATRDVLRIGGVDKSNQNNAMSKLQIVMIDEDTQKKTGIEITLGA